MIYIWSKVWPTTPGMYWFYGWPWDKDSLSNRNPELGMMRVIHGLERYPVSQGRRNV